MKRLLYTMLFSFAVLQTAQTAQAANFLGTEVPDEVILESQPVISAYFSLKEQMLAQTHKFQADNPTVTEAEYEDTFEKSWYYPQYSALVSDMIAKVTEINATLKDYIYYFEIGIITRSYAGGQSRLEVDENIWREIAKMQVAATN